MSHTPTPWFCDSSGKIYRTDPKELYENGGGTAGDHPIATVHSGFTSWENKFPVEANAKRIVACVNACEGLKQHYLETLVIDGSTINKEVVLILAKKEKAERERDSLLEALERISNLTLSQFAVPHDMAAECVSLACHALARRPA